MYEIIMSEYGIPFLEVERTWTYSQLMLFIGLRNKRLKERNENQKQPRIPSKEKTREIPYMHWVNKRVH